MLDEEEDEVSTPGLRGRDSDWGIGDDIRMGLE